MQPALAPAIHSTAQQQSPEHVSEQHLRDQLLGVVGQSSHPAPPHAQPHQLPPQSLSSHVAPHEQHGGPNIDPAIASSAAMNAAVDSAAQSLAAAQQNEAQNKAYGKRELSTSKRAAQNRAAQRAFRQRKEGYIRKLEEENQEMKILSENYNAVKAENYQLRDYIISLQSRLLESGRDVPPIPSNIDLSRRPAYEVGAGQDQQAPPQAVAASQQTQTQAQAQQAQHFQQLQEQAQAQAAQHAAQQQAQQQQNQQQQAPPTNPSEDSSDQPNKVELNGGETMQQ